MTFLERYRDESTWQGKAMLMEIYHLAMLQRIGDWTLQKTAIYFECSVGLVSENLKLAKAVHDNPKVLDFQSRQEALRKVKYR